MKENRFKGRFWKEENICRLGVSPTNKSRLGVVGLPPDPQQRTRGFTLIELLVVVLIIGILAAVALPQYQKAVLKSKYVELQTIVNALKVAEEAYYLEHGTYTSTLTDLDIAYTLPKDVRINTWLDETNKSGTVYGHLLHGGQIILQYHYYLFGSNVRQCRTDEDNDTAKAVCEGLGGVYRATYGTMATYDLP